MKKYTVNDICDMLYVTPDTVRRWIKVWKLKATKNKKVGIYSITDVDLYSFLSNYYPGKYQDVIEELRKNNPDLDKEIELRQLPTRISKAEIRFDIIHRKMLEYEQEYEEMKKFVEELKAKYEELKGEKNE